MNKRTKGKTGRIGRHLWRLLFMCWLLYPSFVSAQRHIELRPFLTVGEEFDDNINLDYRDKESDFITTVSPGFSLSLLSQHTLLDLTYAPTFVWYAKESDNNTTRQSGTLTFGRDLSQNWRLDASDTFLRSEEPLEEAEAFEGVVATGTRRTRNTYWRNEGRASASYTFAQESALTVGYSNSLLMNDSETEDDGTIQNLYASAIYWFDIRNGMEVNGEYTIADFTNDTVEPQDDYTGFTVGGRYIRRFSPHTTASLGYDYTRRDFDGETENYGIHSPYVRVEHAYSPTLSFVLGLGYFWQVLEDSDGQDGYTFEVNMTKNFQHGSFILGGNGGYEEQYLVEEPSGFVQYWSGQTRVDYQLYETVTGYAGGFYRLNEDQDNRQWSTWQGNVGARWNFLRWLSLSLDYLHSEQDDDVQENSYTDNRVMLLFTASTLYRW